MAEPMTMPSSVEAVLAWISECTNRDDLKKIRNHVTKQLYSKPRGIVGEVYGVVVINDLEAELIAKKLEQSVKENFPFVKDVDIQKWTKDIERIHNVDKFPYDLIEAVMLWSQQDDFWKQNVRSGAALRRHFEKMLVKIKSQGERKGRVHSI